MGQEDSKKIKNAILSKKPNIRKYFRKKLLEGTNPRFDKAFFRFFDSMNEFVKSMVSRKTRSLVCKLLVDYLLEVVPGYDSALPLLGSEEEEAVLKAYKKKRILAVAKPCDVILVRGNQRISRIIQTLTKSPYSHAVFYKGNGKIIEAEPDGVMENEIDKYLHLDIRICRPVMLSSKGKKIVIDHMNEMLKMQPKYDVANIEKLLFKYWYTKFRPDIKVYIGGSTDFEKYYICSGLIAHGFHKAGYPVTPSLRLKKRKKKITELNTVSQYEKLVRLYKKNFSQIVPGDFDNSPFFASVKFLYLDSKHMAKKRFQLELENELNEILN